MAKIRGGSDPFGYLFTSKSGNRFTLTLQTKMTKKSAKGWKKAGWNYRKIWGK